MAKRVERTKADERRWAMERAAEAALAMADGVPVDMADLSVVDARRDGKRVVVFVVSGTDGPRFDAHVRAVGALAGGES